mmetsp:Transcript_57060/g.131013  ORF Transcript_57060/g.131013 Transcript_57060/m.131013 type:complete len:313 (-) Transcript_57060:357-1295(-)
MGGLDLLPPGKAAARERSSPLRVASAAALVLFGVCVTLYVLAGGVARPMHKFADVTQAATPLLERHEADGSFSPSPPLPPPPPVAVAASVEASPPLAEAGKLTAATESRRTETMASSLSSSIVALELNAAGQRHTLRLRLLPEHSESSVAFVRHAASSGCAGELYRSEKDFLVQGRISCTGSSLTAAPKVVKGGCPAGAAVDTARRCPSHDPSCGCHGPIMTKGMVGWAGGSAGPDFFIYTAAMDTARCPVGGCAATHWSRDHTVFAMVADDATWATINELYSLPVRPGGMTFFREKIAMVVAWAAGGGGAA